MTTRIITILAVTGLLLLYGCKSDSPSAPQATYPSGISFSPGVVQAVRGQPIEMTVMFADLTDSVFAVSLQLSCNHAVVSADNAAGLTPGDLFGSDAMYFMQDTLSTIHLAVTRTAGHGLTAGTGSLGLLTLSANSAGTCTLTVVADSLRFYSASGRRVNLGGIDITPAVITVQ